MQVSSGISLLRTYEAHRLHRDHRVFTYLELYVQRTIRRSGGWTHNQQTCGDGGEISHTEGLELVGTGPGDQEMTWRQDLQVIVCRIDQALKLKAGGAKEGIWRPRIQRVMTAHGTCLSEHPMGCVLGRRRGRCGHGYEMR